MAGITIDRNARTLTTDALAGLGVTIKDIELKCNTCGFSYLLRVPRENGKFSRTWYECPGGCNSKRRRGTRRGRQSV